MSKLLSRAGLVVVALHSFLLCNVVLGFTPWTNANGAATSFTWTGGGSDNGRFGNPILVAGNTFSFTPEDFRAESVNGSPANVSDRLQVDLHALPGLGFTGILIREGGDYGLLGTGQVSAGGLLTVEDLDQARNAQDPLAVSPGMPVVSGTGAWDATAGVAFPPPMPGNAWTNIRLILQNDLAAVSDPGSIAFIQKKFLGESLIVEILVPEPAVLTLLALCAPFTIPHRRRCV